MPPNKSIKALTKTKLNATDDESYTMYGEHLHFNFLFHF